MPLIVFETGDHRSVELSIPGGGPLVDVCDRYATPVPFSCRSATCGTCCVRIVEGVELLLPASSDELEVLDALGEHPSQARLACQARVVAGTGCLRLRVPDY
jgi:ferredoxin